MCTTYGIPMYIYTIKTSLILIVGIYYISDNGAILPHFKRYFWHLNDMRIAIFFAFITITLPLSFAFFTGKYVTTTPGEYYEYALHISLINST